MKPFVLFLIAICISACSSVDNTDIQRILDVDDCKIISDNLSDYIEDVKIIKLEQSDSNFVYGISKILLAEDKLIIYSVGELFAFNYNGEFLFRIGRLGRGPGEYIALNDVCISSFGDELLCLNHQNEVLRFSIADGAYRGMIKTEHGVSSDAIFPMSESTFAVFFANPPMNYQSKNFDHIKVFSKTGRKQESYLANLGFNIPIAFRPYSVQSAGNSYVLVPSPSSGPAYIFSEGKMMNFADVRLGKNTLDAKRLSNQADPWVIVDSIFDEDCFKCPMLCQTSDYQYLTVFGKNSSVWNFMFGDNNKIGWQSIPDSAAPIFFKAADKEYFYFSYEESMLHASSDPLKSYLINEHNLILPENHGPVVVAVKFKNL